MKYHTKAAPAPHQYMRLMIARTACHWVVEQGIESAAAGVAMLLAVADGLESDSTVPA